MLNRILDCLISLQFKQQSKFENRQFFTSEGHSIRISLSAVLSFYEKFYSNLILLNL